MKGPRVHALMAIGVAGLAVAAEARDPGVTATVDAGRKIALDTCATCHVVAADQDIAPILKQSTPSFSQIANAPGSSRASLLRFIGATHWDRQSVPITMPNPMLSEMQKGQVVSYILSLRRRP
jgi:mono/diheme cytochrome c family protein